MKKILLLLAVLSSLLFSAIDERKTDVYFANGILTIEKIAKANAFLLESAIKQKSGINYYNQYIGKVGYSYNSTNGWFGSLDVLEAVLQKFNWTKLSDLFNASHGTDLSLQIAAYQNSIKSGHAVLVVAHSQGNLFSREAYIALGKQSKDAWMQNYFGAVSIASPMSANIKFGTERIDWDNDIVPRIATLGYNLPWMISNDVRKVSWTSNNPFGVNKPDSNYVNKSDINRTFSNGYHYKAKEEGLNGAIHAFSFYMGENLKDGKKDIINPFNNKTLKDLSAKTKIMAAIDTQLKFLNATPSQYKIKFEKRDTNLCEERRAELVHFKGAVDPIDVVYPFNRGGKVYEVEDVNNTKHYVLASLTGTKILDMQNPQNPTDTLCYKLQDTSDEIHKSGCDMSTIVPKKGVVTVSLNWDDADIDLDLHVGWDVGTHDIKDVKCPTEHFFIASEYSIYPGRFSVRVSNTKSVDESLLPETIQINIKVPGKFESYMLDINTSSELNIGHVADIVVKYIDGEIVLTPVATRTGSSFRNHSRNGGGGGSRNYISSSSYIRTLGNSSINNPYNPCNMSCGCMPCSYEIIPYLEQALLGPLSGADVELHIASQYGVSSPIYTGVTSSGSTLYSAGIINLDEALKATLDDNELYIFTVTGGKDIDANDDFKIDTFPTINLGKIRAVLTGKEIKEIGFKVNILSEIAYQITKGMYGGVESNEVILSKLDEVATLLLKDKIYTDSSVTLGHADLLVWLPTIDKNLLFVDYTSSIQPIVDDIYYDKDIYKASYNVVYFPNGVAAGFPRLKSSILRVNEHSASGTYVGNVSVYDEGNSSISSMTMSGDGVENFILDDSGSISVSSNADLDFEKKQIYKFSLSASNSNGEGSSVFLYIVLNNIVDVPVAISFTSDKVFDNANAGDLIGKITFDKGASPITSMLLLGEGSEYFDIDSEGHITVGANGFTLLNEIQSDYRKKSLFKLEVIAQNDLGQSFPVKLGLEIYHIRVSPTLMNLTASVDENATALSVVDTIKFNEGISEVLGFTLSGSGSENFEVDNFGVISLSNIASLDYETKKAYEIMASAHNQAGISEAVRVDIRVNNSPDVPELKIKTKLSIDENATVGTVVGNIIASKGNSVITEINLQTNSGLYDINNIFEVDLSGNIKLKIQNVLDYEGLRSYYFKATATNIDGQSQARYYTISINNSPDVPELKRFYEGIYENAPTATFIGNILAHSGNSDITDFSLSGNGSENFEVDLNGDIRVSSSANLDYEGTNRYFLKATATNTQGSTTRNLTIYISDIQDVPLLKSFYGSVNENSAPQTVVGQINIIQGVSPIISMSLSANENFTIDIDGTIKVASGATIDYENRTSYILRATAVNSQGTSNASYVSITVNDMPDVPNVQGFSVSIDENISAGTILGSVKFNEGASPITALEFSGIGSEQFDIDLTGLVTVKAGAILDYDYGDRFYHFNVIATNVLGSSSSSQIRIRVKNIHDIAEINRLDIRVDENIPIGTKIGKLEIIEGMSPLISVDFFGARSELFSVDTSGNITTKGNLDYEQYSFHSIIVRATNLQGISVPARVFIQVNDIMDSPVIENFTGYIDERADFGSVIGTLNFTNGSHPIDSFSLSGSGSNLFAIDKNGVISLREGAILDYERTQVYNLEATAYASSETSPLAYVEIIVNNIIEEPLIADFFATITESSSLGVIVGNVKTINLGDNPIESMTLSGVGSDDFVITADGLISLKSDIKFDYERQQSYYLSVIAHTSSGLSEAKTLNITVNNSLDAPTYLNFSGEIKEYADFGTVVGQIPSFAHKDTDATSMQLSGDGNEHFLIDAKGEISLANVQLDFESKNFYTLKSIAHTQYGESDEVDVIIEIIDVDEYGAAGLGRWGGANVNIYKLEENLTKTLLFNETTSLGSDVNSTGVFDSHRLELESDSFYIYEVSGGEDYDANNDGIMDIIPTPNSGTIHAIVKGSWIRHTEWRPRISLASEMFYQLTRDERKNSYVEDFARKLVNPSHDESPIISRGNAIDALLYNPVSYVKIFNSRYFPDRSLEYIKTSIYENDLTSSMFISNSINNYRYYGYYNNTIALFSDENKFFNVTYGSGLKLIDFSSGALVVTDIMQGLMNKILLSNDNKRLFIKGQSHSYARTKVNTKIVTPPDDVVIFDISDALNPIELSRINAEFYFNEMLLSKDETKLYVTFSDKDKKGLGLIDVSDIMQPTVGTQIMTPGKAVNLKLSQDEQTIFMANSRAGLQIIDVSDANNFIIIGKYITNGLVENIFLSSDETIIYLAVNGNVGWQKEKSTYLQVVDISDKNNPVLIREFDLEDRLLTDLIFNLDKTKMFINSGKLKIYENIGDFQEMVLVGQSSFNIFNAQLSLIEDEDILIATSYYEIYIIDISDSSNPIIIHTIKLNPWPM